MLEYCTIDTKMIGTILAKPIEAEKLSPEARTLSPGRCENIPRTHCISACRSEAWINMLVGTDSFERRAFIILLGASQLGFCVQHAPEYSRTQPIETVLESAAFACPLTRALFLSSWPICKKRKLLLLPHWCSTKHWFQLSPIGLI